MPRPKGSRNKTTGRRFKKWEGRFPEDKHLRMTKDMLMDERFLNLSSSAKTLYLYMKMWAIGHNDIEFSASMSEQFMTKPTYIKARDELVKAGFIDYINSHCARDKHKTAKYEFSDRWTWQNRPQLKKPPDTG